MKVYQHTQTMPSTAWTINHNMGCKPAFDVTVDLGGGAREKIYPLKAEHVTDNQLILEFSASKSGYVRLIGV